LTQGLVQPAILAMEELSHDKVGSRMHERKLPRTAVAPPVALFTESNEAAALDEPTLDQAQPLTIEANNLHRIRDDDPTTLVVRDDDMRASGAASSGFPTQRPSVKSKLLVPGPPKPAAIHARDEAATQNQEATPLIAGTGTVAPRVSRIPLVVVLVLVAVVAAAAGLFVGGMIR
jgi:hypothetical protein